MLIHILAFFEAFIIVSHGSTCHEDARSELFEIQSLFAKEEIIR